jgi:Phosphonate metabolism protein PhnJ
MNAPAYNFAYLDEQTKRMIRRAILKAIAIPGYQVPFASREMPMPYGWGTGGVQVTAAILGPEDVLKVIDQGSRRHHERDLDPQILWQDRGRCNDHLDGGRDRDSDQAPDSRSPAASRPNSGLSGADPGAAAVPRAARDGDAAHA